MKYFYILFFVYFTMRNMVPYSYSYGYSFLKYLKSSLDNQLYLSEKITNTFSLKLLWSHKVGCGSCGYYINLYPDYDGSYIFINDYYGIVKKINFYTGKCIWKKDLSNIIFNNFLIVRNPALLSSGISISKNHLYIGSELAKVYALDTQTGAILWMKKISGAIVSKPVISDDLVVLYTSNGTLQALNVYDGTVIWVVNFFVVPSFSFKVTLIPVISSNIIIIGDDSGLVTACQLDTGYLLWQKKISAIRGVTEIDRFANIVSPIVVDNVVYAIAYNGYTVALDIDSGDLIWSKDIGSLINIVVEDHVIYLVDKDNRVIALNANNGNMIWNKSNLTCFQLLFILSYENYIIVGDSKGYLYSLCKEDGTFLGKKRVTDSNLYQARIILSKIVIYDKHGKLSVWEAD